MPGLSHPKAQGLYLCRLQREESFASLLWLSRWPSERPPAWVTQPTSGRVPHCHNFAQSCPQSEPATCHWRVFHGERRLNYSKQNVKSKDISPSSQSVSWRFCWTQANPWFWCSLYLSPAKQSYIDFSRLHLYWQGEIFLLPFLLLIVWAFVVYLEVLSFTTSLELFIIAWYLCSV